MSFVSKNKDDMKIQAEEKTVINPSQSIIENEVKNSETASSNYSGEYDAMRLLVGEIMKSLSSKKDLTSDEKRMLELLNSDKNYVNEENTVEFMKWYNSHK